jgi:hypothetical protein
MSILLSSFRLRSSNWSDWIKYILFGIILELNMKDIFCIEFFVHNEYSHLFILIDISRKVLH